MQTVKAKGAYISPASESVKMQKRQDKSREHKKRVPDGHATQRIKVTRNQRAILTADSSFLDADIYKILHRNRVFTQTEVTPVPESVESAQSSRVSFAFKNKQRESASPNLDYNRFPSSIASTIQGQSAQKEVELSFDIMGQLNAMRKVTELRNADLDLDESLDDLTEDREESVQLLGRQKQASDVRKIVRPTQLTTIEALRIESSHRGSNELF